MKTRNISREPAALRLPTMVILIVLFVVGLAVALALKHHWARQITNPPALSFVGVRPDGGDVVFGPDGTPRGTVFNDNLSEPNFNGTTMIREFIFMLDDPGAKLAGAVLKLRPTGHGYYRYSETASWQRLMDGRLRLTAGYPLPTTYLKPRLFFLPPRSVNLTTLDVSLEYFDENSPESLAVFHGPFTAGRYPMTTNDITLDLRPGDKPGTVSFEFTCSNRQLDGAPSGVRVFDAMDKPMRLLGSSFHTRNRHQALTIRVRADAHEAVGRIRLLKPQTAEYRNVTVHYGTPPRTNYPAYFEPMAKALNQSPASLRNHHFKSAEEALKVVHLVRGHFIRRAWQAIDRRIKSSPENQAPLWKDLPPAEQEQVLQAARLWIHSDDPIVRFYGARLGLEGRWEGFTDVVIDILEQPQTDVRAETARLVGSYCEQFTPDEITRILRLLAADRHSRHLEGVLECCRRRNHDIDNATLEPLTNSEHPWIQFRTAQFFPPERWGPIAELSPEWQRWIWIAHAGKPGVPASLKTRAVALLQSQLSLAWMVQDPTTFEEAFQRWARHVDPETGTPWLVAFIGDMPTPEARSRMVSRFARQLNRWHDMDFGGLGKDPDKRMEPPDGEVIRDTVAEIGAWSETRGQAERGRVIE